MFTIVHANDTAPTKLIIRKQNMLSSPSQQQILTHLHLHLFLKTVLIFDEAIEKIEDSSFISKFYIGFSELFTLKDSMKHVYAAATIFKANTVAKFKAKDGTLRDY